MLPVIGLAQHDHSTPATALFVNATGVSRSGDLPLGQERSTAELDADLVLGFKSSRFRFLGEVFAENGELDPERLQVGVEMGGSSVLWLGRFHQPASVWNIFYHHGAYLQTSVTRPWLEAWEDDDGAIAQHVDGVLFENQFQLRGDRALGLSLSAGKAPSLLDEELKPFDQAGGQPAGSDNYHYALRLQWMPDPVGEDMIGLVWSSAALPVRRSDQLFGSNIRQSVVGPFVSWSFSNWRFVSSVSSVSVRTTTGVGHTDFTAGYVEADYRARPNLLLYGRVEDIAGVGDPRYLQRFATSEPRRMLVGLRRDLPHKNAVKLELGRVKPLNGQWHDMVALQWSAAIP